MTKTIKAIDIFKKQKTRVKVAKSQYTGFIE